MARLVGVDLPKDKRIIIALTYIQGIGNTTSKNILSKLNIDENIRVKELVEQQIVQLRNELQTNDGEVNCVVVEKPFYDPKKKIAST